MNRFVFALILSCSVVLPSAVFAADPPDGASPLPIPHVADAVTHHHVHIGNRDIAYTATAGSILLRDDKDEPTASVFYVAFVAEGLGPTSHRPITFAYNGGPGGSSALIDIGAFGPRMVVTTNGVATGPAPYKMVDNPDSLLDVTDLVFIDAVGTGFSRLVGKSTGKNFYGVTADGKAFEQFIRRYITSNNRWNSPKYLAGESYGTTRSAVVGKMLEDDGISVRGITLMSTILSFRGDDDFWDWVYLPSEAAIAAYHHKLPTQPSNLSDFLRSARAFARGPYLQALAQGAALPPGERDAIAQQLHAYTGLPVDYILRSRLRVPPERFEKVLLGSDDKTIGRYDGRFSQFNIDPIASDAETDPSADAIFSAFTAAFNQYVRQDLAYKTDANYLFLSGPVNEAWDWNTGKQSDPTGTDVTPNLRDAMTTDPFLRVFSANGLYDLATPFFSTEYELSHLGGNPSLQSRITFGYYPAGHMMYLNPDAHAALKHDLEGFYR